MRLIRIAAILVIVIIAMGARCSRIEEDTVAAPFFGGIEGLVVEFWEIGRISDSGPRNEVWEDQAIPIEVKVMNKGEHTVEAYDVEFEVQGISPSDFIGIDFFRNNDQPIEKVSEFLPQGGEVSINFGDAYFTNLVGTHYDATIKLQFTYPYRISINVPKVCYKEDIKDNTFCIVDGVKQAFASGGPIAVGTVYERYIGRGKIMLEIPIRNVQKGKIKAYKNDEFDVRYDQIAFQVNDPQWVCTSRGNPTVARITRPDGQAGNEEAVIRCINENLEQGALYYRPVTLTFDYYYQDWVTQTVRIRENPE